jgi:hypothetical protein
MYSSSRIGQSRYTPSGGGGAGLLGAVILLILIGIPLAVFNDVHSHSSQREVTLTVTRLDDQSGKDGHQYLIFTRSGEVFKDADNFWLGKHNSSNLFGWLQAGHTYRCDVAGNRQELSSNYRNVIRCDGSPAS